MVSKGDANMYATFNRFELRITKNDALTGSHQGQCDSDIAYLRTKPYIARQLEQIKPETVVAELAEYGAWEPEELTDHDANLDRILWIACGNIAEECSADG